MKCYNVEKLLNRCLIVVKEYGEKAYSFSQNMISVTIPFNRPKQLKNEPVNEPVKLTKSAKKVLQALKTNSESTIDEIVTSISVSRETVKRSTLSEKGLIKRVGSDKTGHWEIIESIL